MGVGGTKTEEQSRNGGKQMKAYCGRLSVAIPQRPKDRNTIQPSNHVAEYVPKEIEIVLL